MACEERSELQRLIKSIDKGTVNQICSGQVVLTLATAIKELLENSLDAGATSVQIRLKDSGCKAIEVVDNGSGVEKANFQGMTLKHHTSKISDFNDLESVETFGFRGEALSSLCSLGDVTITTRHQDSPVGTRLRFDHLGTIVQSNSIARQVGTTVLVEKLFSTLPVRHKEFLRNYRREFGKLCPVLQAYALLNYQCSITCTNQTGGQNRTFLETRVGTLRGNIGSIFGAKQLTGLLEVKTEAPDEDMRAEFRCVTSHDGSDVKLTGFISSCAHGLGRSSPDRQFFYINSRPVDSPKISRLVNEIYHQYNIHQSPFVVLNICVAAGSVDVNVVPDKRQMMLEYEGLVLATVNASLLKLFREISSSMPLQLSKVPVLTEIKIISCHSEVRASTGLARFLAKGAPPLENCEKKPLKQSQLVIARKIPERRPPEYICDTPAAKKTKIDDEVPFGNEVEIHPTLKRNTILPSAPDSEIKSQHYVSKNEESDILSRCDSRGMQMDQETQDEGITDEDKKRRRCLERDVTLEDVKKLRGRPKLPYTKKSDVKFFAKIEPAANERAEEELRKTLPQAAFRDMKIVGQFNRGFIITRLGTDLFIIDQHATDEKANFEMLSDKRVQSQQLTVPQYLQLDAGKEELLRDRSSVILANGFGFQVDESAPAARRVTLTAVPVLKGVTLDHHDVDELLFLLADAPKGQMCRPSKVRDVLASRACRMSVMVGTALNPIQMHRLVSRMAELHQPWNCPHGRPTIRHLLSLDLIASRADDTETV